MNTTDLRFPSNKVRDIERYFHSELDSQYGAGEVGMFLRMLFEYFLGWDHVKLLTSKEETINQSDLLRFHWAVEDLKRNRPIQHIIGWTEFCGNKIAVGPEVLIPRPETEEIVQNTFTLLASNPPKHVIDLCTGSGCIAIAFAKHWPKAKVTAVDLSEKALETAKRNAETNSVDITLKKCDILSNRWDKSLPLCSFDLIISNPPYIMEMERETMSLNVTEHEPTMALFVPDNDPLLFYRSIADFAKKSLSKNGMLVVEINEQLATETCKLLESTGFIATLREDFRGKARSITATLK